MSAKSLAAAEAAGETGEQPSQQSPPNGDAAAADACMETAPEDMETVPDTQVPLPVWPDTHLCSCKL